MEKKKLFLQFAQMVKHRKRAVLFSFCNVIVILFVTYHINNQPLFTGEDLNKYAWMEWLKDKLGFPKDIDHDDALFINVAYDKQLVEKYDDFGMATGNTVITDRSKLLQFLKLLNRSNSYKYVFLDVRFEKGYNVPEVDSALFSEILNMRDIVIADHSDIELADELLRKKAALNDYYATIVATNFVRYRYTYDSIESVPLFAYRETTGNAINKHWIIYTCNNKLCYNSLFVHFPLEKWDEYDDQQSKVYYNLGSDILDNYSDNDIYNLTKDKYIIIGDMVEDIHDTYSGLKPGSVITYYSFLELMKGNHFVRYRLLLLMALLYFFISMSLFETQSILRRIPFIKKSHSRILHFVTDFVEYTLTLTLAMFVLYLFFGIAISILLPSTYFAIQKSIICYKRSKI